MKVSERILFGTDYFITLKEKDEEKLVADFVESLQEENLGQHFHNISGEYAKRYISSEFYKCK